MFIGDGWSSAVGIMGMFVVGGLVHMLLRGWQTAISFS